LDKDLNKNMKKIKNIKTFFNKKNLKYNNFKYLADYVKFKKLGGEATYFHPMLNDSSALAGISKGHYFHQDLLVASYIYKSNPDTHIDIGSRIDGFVAHVASFRKIQIIDIRNLNEIGHENISFIKLDLTKDNNPSFLSESVSCLHAIEHFGLGRYGDAIDPIGHVKGFNNILKIIKKNGTLYISFPISKNNETHFNSQRVFNPNDIFSWTAKNNKIFLKKFDYVDAQGNLHLNTKIKDIENIEEYGCGIYTFIKEF
jgi:hypothetical protein